MTKIFEIQRNRPKLTKFLCRAISFQYADRNEISRKFNLRRNKFYNCAPDPLEDSRDQLELDVLIRSTWTHPKWLFLYPISDSSRPLTSLLLVMPNLNVRFCSLFHMKKKIKHFEIWDLNRFCKNLYIKLIRLRISKT